MASIDEEALDLRDGTRIYVREVQPSDRPLFEEGIRRLSPESWLFRFLMPRDHLEDEELEYLVHPDGVTHYALGAVTRDRSGREGPVAVARYVRLEDQPVAAECALIVLDEFQGRGVGRRMGERLMRAAGERGVALFRCEILLENVRMKHLVERLAPWAEGHVTGSLLSYLIPLDPETSPEDVLGPAGDVDAATEEEPARSQETREKPAKKPKKPKTPKTPKKPKTPKPADREGTSSRGRLFGLRGRRKPTGGA